MKVGIIGAGTISANHIKGYRNNGADVAAICDRHGDLAAAKAEQYGIPKVYTEVCELLANPDIDIISIATPVSSHTPLVLQALEAGKHVLCEKPPAMNEAEVEACIAARDKAKKVLQYGFVCHHDSDILWLRERYLKGEFGRVAYAEAMRINRCINPGGWFNDKRFTKGGSLFDAAIHEIDALFFVLDYPELASVRSFLRYENGDLHARLGLTGKSYASASVGEFESNVETSGTIFAVCRDGTPIVLRAASALCTVKECRQFRIDGSGAGAFWDGSHDLAYIHLEKDGFREESVPRSDRIDLDEEMKNFLAACRGEAPCIATAEMARSLMRFYDAVYRSDAEGREILL